TVLSQHPLEILALPWMDLLLRRSRRGLHGLARHRDLPRSEGSREQEIDDRRSGHSAQQPQPPALPCPPPPPASHEPPEASRASACQPLMRSQSPTPLYQRMPTSWRRLDRAAMAKPSAEPGP